MRYQVIGTLKVRTLSGARQLKSGDLVALPDDMARRLIDGGRVRRLSPDCFSPDGTLEATFTEAKAGGWTDGQLGDHIDALRETGTLRATWGFIVKDSPVLGDFWIISDAAARDKLPAGAKSFSIEELRPIVEAVRVFKGAKVVEVRL